MRRRTKDQTDAARVADWSSKREAGLNDRTACGVRIDGERREGRKQAVIAAHTATQEGGPTDLNASESREFFWLT